ncbi:MAG TPA: hypothetical protein VM657_10185 [Sphingomonas sp.]|nr:hypothetical protein [Sphingomonas sp.]
MDMSPTTLPTLADRAQRYDGWTPDRQRAFLEAIAEGHTVGSACAQVGMAPSSAYALRRRAAGAGFALGWRAANLLAREKVADTLLARAIDGQVETVTRPDGSTYSRHRYDNRLASTMLARLDRFADKEAGEATHHAARLVAAEFDGFLDLIEKDQGPARTGLFLAARIGDADPDLGAVQALARADRWLRTGNGVATEVDTHDLDPGARATWTAEQWVRAEAAGLVAFTAPSDPARHSPLSPLHPDPDGEEEDETLPVWWCDYADEWRTHFPPPVDFCGMEVGTFGDSDYERTLSNEERALVEAPHEAETAARRITEGRARDAWFAALAEELAPDEVDPDAPDPDALDPVDALDDPGAFAPADAPDAADRERDAIASDPAPSCDIPAPDCPADDGAIRAAPASSRADSGNVPAPESFSPA